MTENNQSINGIYARVPVIEMKYMTKDEFQEFIEKKEKKSCKTCAHWKSVIRFDYGRCDLNDSQLNYVVDEHICNEFEWDYGRLKKLAEDGCYL